MNLEDKLFTLANGKQYMVITQIEEEGSIYVCLSNKDNELDVVYKELVIDGEKLSFRDPDPTLFKNVLFAKFRDKLINE